ncbi:bifunctional acetate--CoA ligase family protein/GNAT family N-acetyltransferase [soil metagenome]
MPVESSPDGMDPPVRRSLHTFFQPRAVALIGATDKPGSVGRTILTNLIASPFGGTVYPVNPKRPSVLGIQSHPSVASIPEPVDLAVIVTPPASIPAIVAECGAAGVPGAIVISAGFKEVGPEGAELERQVVADARRHRMRLIGPNCLGVMSPPSGLNATFAAAMARKGRVAFASQSGALITAVLDWSLRERVGFSAIVSLGSMADVGWGDLIDYLGDDPGTDAIVLYMETVGGARSFLSAAREVALAKPIIVMKPGRSEEAARAAASHTGSLTGSDEILDAAFRRAGVLRADRISDLFYFAEVLGKQPRPRGNRLTVLSNAGGPGVLATDALIEGGGRLAELSADTISALDAVLPSTWSRANPIDIIGDAPPDRYAAALDVLSRDPETDGLLVILTPQAMTDPTKTAQQLVPFANAMDKTVMASWMGGLDVEAGERILDEAGIATFPYPDSAARMFTELVRYSEDLTSLYETPDFAPDGLRSPQRADAGALIKAARANGRTVLSEPESKDLLSAYGIPVVETRIAESVEAAVASAEALGYPVVLKLYSHTITHKTDVGGVRLDLADAEAVRAAWAAIETAVAEGPGAQHFQGVTVQPMIPREGYELIVGSSVDSQFGPVLLFGLGGELVEVFRDRALGLPPLTTTLARRMIERTRVHQALKGVRGRKPVDLAALERLLVRFSELVMDQPAIAEIDINPLLASADRLVALDARVILHPPDVAETDLPRPAIRPYPHRYVSTWTSPDGQIFRIRPIRPEDEALAVDFHGRVSEESVYQRYFTHLGYEQRVAHDRLVRVCFTDYDREIALVAECPDPAATGPRIAGIARLIRLPASASAEFALIISDDFQGHGLGRELLGRLVEVGRQEGLERIVAEILAANGTMIHLARQVGFSIRGEPTEGVVHAELRLAEAAPTTA